MRQALRAGPAGLSAALAGRAYAHDRLRVAYLSADFNEHPTAYLTAGLFEQHDKSRFEITALSFGQNDNSPARRRLEAAFEHFIDVRDNSDQEIAALMRRSEIDIAVDLMGFTKDNRLGVLARRAAPIQVNYLGYPGTMGAPYMDYILADATVIPEHHDAFYAERVVRLPGTYQINDNRRAVSQHTPTRGECGLPQNAFVFCCFNNPQKITPEIFDIWMRLLRATEGSVLWLIAGNAKAAANLRLEAEKRGVAPERLIFAPKASVADHLARHRLADLCLDTLPYNAHTTASDALWAGLPVLTCLGETFAGRVAASLLKAIGLDALITRTLGRIRGAGATPCPRSGLSRDPQGQFEPQPRHMPALRYAERHASYREPPIRLWPKSPGVMKGRAASMLSENRCDLGPVWAQALAIRPIFD